MVIEPATRTAVDSAQEHGGGSGQLRCARVNPGKPATAMARNEQELQHRGQRSDLPLLLPPVLSVLYHQVLVRYGVLEEENGVGKVWERDLYFILLLEVRWVFVDRHSYPDPSYL